MDLRFADDVQTIVEEGSISDAAKRLNISQPALSARIKKLEDVYGIQIFKRNRRPVALTEEGQMYLRYVSKAQSLDKEFRMAVVQAGELVTGDLVVGGTHLYTCQFLPPAIREFTRRWPGVSVRVVNEKAPVLTTMAAKGEIDLFITNAEKKTNGISYEPLFDVNMYFCVPREYPVNRDFRENGFDLAKLEDYPFILLDKSQYMGAALRRLFRRYDIDPSKRIYTDQAITALALAKAGAGIALMYGSPDAAVPDTGMVIPDSGPTVLGSEDVSLDLGDVRPGSEGTRMASSGSASSGATGLAVTGSEATASGSAGSGATGLCLYATDDEEMRAQISVAYAENAPLSPAARVFVDTLKESSVNLAE